MKRILCFILTIVMALSAFSITAFAQDSDVSDVLSDYEYFTVGFEEDCFVSITKYNGDDKNLVIPSEIEGHPVKEISTNAFSMCKAETIVIPDTVNYIWDSAFECCRTATSITIPDSVIVIGQFAFSNCNNVEDFKIPSKVKEISQGAFFGCEKLSEVYIPESTEYIGSQAFSACDDLISIKVDENNKFFDSRDNSNCIIKTDTNTLVCATNTSFIPDTVEHIGDNAFSWCTKIEAVEIPASVKTIGYEAFSFCDNLHQLILPATVEEVGANFTYSTHIHYIVFHNPECNIKRGYYHIGALTVIYGYEGSTAQAYTHTDLFDAPFVNIDDIIGDVDGDKKITIMDTTLVQQLLAKASAPTHQQIVSSDTDKNGKLSVIDATKIQLYIASFITEF